MQAEEDAENGENVIGVEEKIIGLEEKINSVVELFFKDWQHAITNVSESLGRMDMDYMNHFDAVLANRTILAIVSFFRTNF